MLDPSEAPAAQEVRLIPLEEIDADAIIRDRTALAPEAIEELVQSIARTGLRMPIEVFPHGSSEPPHRWGLLSGLRRLHAYRHIHQKWEVPAYRAIPAFVRDPSSLALKLTAMVEENAMRAPLSPWEEARIAVRATDRHIFRSLDEAVEELYPTMERTRRSRIRLIADVVEELDLCFKEPERLSLRQCIRLGLACKAGLGEVIASALATSTMHTKESQWQLILPLIEESEHPATRRAAIHARPGRPKRLSHVRNGLVIRREMTPDGWCLQFTGRHATGGLIEDIMDEVERLYGK